MDVLGYVSDGCVICPDCVDAETERDEETGVFFEPYEIGHDATCDCCHDFMTYDGDWIKPDFSVSWQEQGIRWATCKDCNSKYAFEVNGWNYRDYRATALSGKFACPNCRGKVQF